jgi:hypothetical protein
MHLQHDLHMGEGSIAGDEMTVTVPVTENNLDEVADWNAK